MIALRWLDLNDYLGTVFDYVVSLRGSCRNNFRKIDTFTCIVTKALYAMSDRNKTDFNLLCKF